MDLLVQAKISDHEDLIKMTQEALCKIAYEVLSKPVGEYGADDQTFREMSARAIKDGSSVARKLAPILVTIPEVQAILSVVVSDIENGPSTITVDIVGATPEAKAANTAAFGGLAAVTWFVLKSVL